MSTLILHKDIIGEALIQARNELLAEHGASSIPPVAVMPTEAEKIVHEETPPVVPTAHEEPTARFERPPILDPEAPLHTKKVDMELNKLLTEWFGHAGFMGMWGKSGLEHPEFLATKDLFVTDIIADDIPQEVRVRVKRETLGSIVENITAWRQSIAPLDREMFGHYLRRIIVENLERGVGG